MKYADKLDDTLAFTELLHRRLCLPTVSRRVLRDGRVGTAIVKRIVSRFGGTLEENNNG